MFAEIEHAQLPKANKHWRDWEKYVGEETLPIEFEAFSSHKLYVDILVKSGDIEKTPGPRLILFSKLLFSLCYANAFSGKQWMTVLNLM